MEVNAIQAKVYLTLGEVAMDLSNHSQAQEDFQTFTVLPVFQAMSGMVGNDKASLTTAIYVTKAM